MRSKFNIICTVTITSTMSMMLRPSFHVFQIWINTLVLSQSSPCKGTHLFKHIGLYTKFIVVNSLQTLVLTTLLLWPCNCIFYNVQVIFELLQLLEKVEWQAALDSLFTYRSGWQLATGWFTSRIGLFHGPQGCLTWLTDFFFFFFWGKCMLKQEKQTDLSTICVFILW